MISSEIIFSIVTFIFCSGVVYGALSNRIKNLEKSIHENKDIGERLAKIETKVEILVNHINK
jgi:archaellum component FlaG (FlaF/FlaG flagellin family)